MIQITKVINVGGYSSSVMAYDDVYCVDLMFTDEEVVVLFNGDILGKFVLRTIVLNIVDGIVQFIRDDDEDYFYNKIAKVLYPQFRQYFMPKPYDGIRW